MLITRYNKSPQQMPGAKGEKMPNPPPGCNTWQEYMKRRITIDTSGIEPETRVKTRHLPLVVYADAPWRLTRAIRDDVLCTSPGVGQSTAGCDTGRPKITLRR